MNHENSITLPWLSLLVAMLAAGCASVSPEILLPRDSPMRADFNGDGFPDIAVGVPGEDIGNVNAAGAVNVLYGTSGGLSSNADQIWHQNSPGIDEEEAEQGDQFGASLAVGDFDNDGFSDLAIGVPFESIEQTITLPDGTEIENVTSLVGAVHVLYGSRNRLSVNKHQLWHQESPGIAEQREPFDLFGKTLAAGDFNKDGFSDLAIGAPLEGFRSIVDLEDGNPGIVHIVYGSSEGLSTIDPVIEAQIFSQDNLEGFAGNNDQFGAALAVGDFDKDGFADLAVGVPLDRILGSPGGAVNVLYGSSEGLSPSDNQHLTQNSFPGAAAEPHDRFGAALAVGDFDADGFSDLAVGVPGEDIEDNIEDAGVVNVLYGSSEGLSTSKTQLWHQNQDGIKGGAEPGDRFGSALAAGDFNGDRASDLAVGVPGEDFGAGTDLIGNAGAVNVLYGSLARLSADDNQLWHQDSSGIARAVEEEDQFGFALFVEDFNNDAFADLAIGAPGEKFSVRRDAGAVLILFGSSSRLSAASNEFWNQDSLGVKGAAQVGDLFGGALSAGLFRASPDPPELAPPID